MENQRVLPHTRRSGKSARKKPDKVESSRQGGDAKGSRPRADYLQGRPQEAVALLAAILGWFTEGFDTADLKDVKALLDKLTEPAIAAEG